MRWCSAAALLWLTAAGCGLRSDPLSGSETEIGDDTDIAPRVEGQRGTCTNPIELPGTTDSIISGMLEGDGLYRGWCGGDFGREDVYRFVADRDTDVTIHFDAERTSFDPLLLVQASACGSEASTVLCERSSSSTGGTEPRHFFARAGAEYFVIVDAPDRAGGRYTATVGVDPPPLDQCAVHPETIVQLPGSTFSWSNEFGAGQGRADGACGGPGRENMFRLTATRPGNVFIFAQGWDGFRPVVGIRRGCGGTTELSCSSEDLEGTPGSASLVHFIPDAGEYYITIDNLSVEGGAYSLEVYFD